MPPIQPKKYVLSDRCTRSCSLNSESLKFAAETIDWYNDARSLKWMVAKSEELGRKLSPAALSRHRSHLDEAEDTSDIGTDGTVDHLVVLQRLITEGAKRSKQWRVGPAEMLKAMDMYYKLTQGSAVLPLLTKLTQIAAGEDAEDVGEFDAGSLSPAEMESLDADSD